MTSFQIICYFSDIKRTYCFGIYTILSSEIKYFLLMVNKKYAKTKTDETFDGTMSLAVTADVNKNKDKSGDGLAYWES